ncbi:unnamed protein product, partial [Rotaria socialis]
NSDCPTVDQLTNEVSYDEIKSQESSSNVVEKQRDNAEQLYNDNLGIHQMKLFVDELKGEFIKRFDQFHTQIKGLEQKIEHVDKRLNKKIDQLSQKIDNIYETNATQLILNRLRADHNLDVPYTPTYRMFSKNYSTYTENLFNRFEKYLKHNYEHLWKKIHQDILIS